MYEWFEKRRSETMLSPLLEEEEVEDMSWASISSSPALKQQSSISSSRRRLRVEHERRLLRLLKSTCRTTDSEITDYDYGAHPSSNGGIYIDNDDDDDNFGYNDGVSDYYGGKIKRRGVLRLCAVIVVTIAAVALYLAAFVESLLISTVEGSVDTDASVWASGVACATCLMTSTLVWRSEVRLSHAVSLRYGVRGLRCLAKRLTDELKILAKEKEALIAEVGRLEQSRIILEQIVKDRNDGNVDELVKRVRENQAILRKMKENIRQSVLQDVVKLVLHSDVDRDGYISKRESDVLVKRLLISMEAYGIVFDTQKFHHAVGLNPSIYGVLAIVRRLLPDENNKPSSFYSLDSIDSDPEHDKVGLEGVWEEEGKDDVYDMFYVPVEEDFHRGNARAIRLCKEFCARNGELPRLISISPARRNRLAGLRCSVSGGDDCESNSVVRNAKSMD
ncbi:hypothetical protein ACHAXA_003215 [Cyclostephanos tholiformis]|uniref:EF-hand domain-containing protein n=1 Tax=Cyclostephanos tholiformis TaxID=382380 RepID=A0ABD3RYJ5_9STRA